MAPVTLPGFRRAGGARSAKAAACPGRPLASPPTVLYIAGSGRSGSTLLERVLGELPGFVNVGELIDLFRREASSADRCGCGRNFAGCGFWANVGERAFGGWMNPAVAEVHPLQRRVARQRYLPQLLAISLAGGRFRADVARYGACYARLYRAIAAEAGAACVVDASKWPVQALALYRGGVDVRVIHLVRDVRGVAHSLSKAGSRPVISAAKWVNHQSQAGLLRRCGLPFVRVRYEDFVRQPRRSVGTALSVVGLSFRPSDLDHLRDKQATLAPGHGIHGNFRLRFRHGDIALYPDEEWRERMTPHDRILVTATGLPFLLLHYRRRPANAREGAVRR